MSTAVEALTKWFAELSPENKKEIVEFLYGGRGKFLVQDGMYLGPRPGVVQKGLFLGPVPSSGSNSCPTCGKPW